MSFRPGMGNPGSSDTPRPRATSTTSIKIRVTQARVKTGREDQGRRCMGVSEIKPRPGGLGLKGHTAKSTRRLQEHLPDGMYS